MNSPSPVFPWNCEPGLQYLPERVFTQTSLAAVAGAVLSRAGGLARTYYLVRFDPVGGYLALGGL